VTAVFRSLALTLALAGMMLRAALPMGWMPDVGGQGGGLVICTMDGLHHVPAQDHPAADERNNVCPFAAAAQLAPPQLGTAVPIPVSVAYAVPALPDVRIAAAFLDPGHAPRGPPLSV
jgi:hypothetical protein